jgi:tetratricopeptide (TPR) repeat protein
MNTEAIPQLTTLLAAHGVYALTILFIFYQQRRTYADFKGASDENRPFLRTIYNSSVVATYVLAALSTGFWAYNTFFRLPPYVWVDGAVDDVKNAVAQPATPRDPPSVVQTIEPDSGLNMFMSEKVKCDPRSGLCQLRWALKTRSDMPSIAFKFLHTYVIAKLPPSASDPSEGGHDTVFDTNTVGTRFSLDASAIGLAAGRELSLRYVQNDDPKLIGALYVRDADRRWVAVQWDTLPADSAPKIASRRESSLWRLPIASLWTVWAAELGGKGSFGARGEYPEEFGRNLRGWLGGSAVPLQQSAVQIVVDGRERAFKFILDSQTAPLPISVNRSVMTSNLVRASEAIEARGTALPKELVVSLAVASSQNGNYEMSARLFDKVRPQPLPALEPYFYRGLAYRETGRYREAIADLERYARDIPSPYSKAVAYTSIGISYRRSRETARAIAYYEQAIKTYPNYAGPYNSLAYLHALDPARTDFTEALVLVDKALKLRPDDPNYHDTKGWILFRMHRYEEARTFLEMAYRELPNDPDVEEHVKRVRKAIGQSIQKGR